MHAPDPYLAVLLDDNAPPAPWPAKVVAGVEGCTITNAATVCVADPPLPATGADNDTAVAVGFVAVFLGVLVLAVLR